MSNKPFTALPEGLEGAGLICWWELSGRINPEALAEALLEEGLTVKVPTTSAHAALAQSVNRLAGARAARAHGVIAIRAGSGSWFLVERHLVDGGADVALAAFARVEVDDTSGKVQAVVLRDNPSVDIADEIAIAATNLLDTTASGAVSAWLSSLHLRVMFGTALRSSGGFYYIPASQRPTFEALWRAVTAVSDHRMSSIDALPTAETVNAVSQALRREYDIAIAELETDLGAAVDGISKRAKLTKIARCEALRSKLGVYTALLGDALEDIDDQVASLGAALALVPETGGE